MTVQMLEHSYCCCSIFSLDYALYLMTLHAFLHGSFGVLFIVTSLHRVSYVVINFVAAVSNGAFIPLGLYIFWVALNQSSGGAKICGYILAVVTTVCFVATALYIGFYMKFAANSQIDRGLLSDDASDVIKEGDAPFTFWHLLGICFLIFTPVWWYQMCVLRRYSYILNKEEPLEFGTTESSRMQSKQRTSFDPFLRK